VYSDSAAPPRHRDPVLRLQGADPTYSESGLRGLLRDGALRRWTSLSRRRRS